MRHRPKPRLWQQHRGTVLAPSLTQPKQFWRAALLRGAGLWCGVRVAVFFLFSLANLPWPEPVQLSPVVSLMVVVTAAALAQVHSIAMKERIFLGNMGVGSAAWAAPAGAASALEVLARVVIAMVVS